MKKLLCLILAFLMLVSVASCGSVTDPQPESEDNSNNSGETEIKEDEQTTKEQTTDEPVYDGIFQTGYARVAITPELPIGDFTEVKNDIHATCVAVYDGEQTLMFISLDIGSIMENYCDDIRSQVYWAADVPFENIFITAVHNHSSPTFGESSRWKTTSLVKIGEAAKAAVKDLSDTEMFIGTGKTTGMAFVRRYVDAFGRYASVSPTKPDGKWLNSSTTRTVSEADDTLQVIRFAREDKKDIIAMNWQAHFAHAIDAEPGVISSDMAHYIRQDVEAGDDDALVAYFAGASGNINLNPPNQSARKYNDYVEVAHALAEVTLEVIKEDNLTRASAGKINITKKVYAAEHKKDSASEIAAAQNRLNASSGGVLAQAGDRYLVERNKSKSSNLRIAAISFGDLAFITAPYEMFDNNGVQIKEGSPFKMTFIITNSDGAYAYMPSYEACTKYGGYETKATYFATGVAEKLVAEFLAMLSEIKQTN